MTAKEFFHAIRKQNVKLGEMTERLEMMRSQAESTASSISHTTGGKGSPEWRAKLIDDMVDYNDKVCLCTIELLNMHRKADVLLNTLPNASERCLLEIFFILGYDIDKTCSTMNREPSYVYRLRKKAFQRIDEHIKEHGFPC